ncbi:MAG: bifunctional ADP-dependent NAD(P)H-hydrate dehydratase/NAD(P)H-hydrate epimerase [Spirochaetales bacterium]|nr:bifunctional ADP-dependent NAD(P)H-hydrate dehydratase/NAD(P)H-hydrate epimerase [Spirochaetales bacterium]
MKIVTSSEELKRVDSAAKKVLPSLVLMESAALQCWFALSRLIERSSSLLFLIGGGNNGADGIAIARHAYHAGWRKITVLHTATRYTDEHAFQQTLLKEYPIRQLWLGDVDLDDLPPHDWIIDAIAGLGLNGPLHERLGELVFRVNRSDASVFSVDIPSGLGDRCAVSGLCISSDHTVALGSFTRAHYHPLVRSRCGNLRIANPSFPLALLNSLDVVATVDDEPLAIPALEKSAYKNTRGSIAIFGSSVKYTGAARLAANAAFTARSGLVTLFCDPEIHEICASSTMSIMVRSYKGEPVEGFDAILAGPGWGDGREELLKVLLCTPVPLVLDADGIRSLARLIASKKMEGRIAPTVLTPHLGEMRILGEAVLGRPCFESSESPETFFSDLKEVARFLEATIVLKSSLIHVVDPDGTITILEGLNPSLGVAGSGDLLAGMVTAFLGQGFSAHDSSLIAGKILFTSAQAANEEIGYYDSETLLPYIGRTVKEAER